MDIISANSSQALTLDKPPIPKEEIKDMVIVLVAVLDGLTNVVLSGDQWHLAFYAAQSVCCGPEVGMDEATFGKIANRLNDYRRARKSLNPLKDLFGDD